MRLKNMNNKFKGDLDFFELEDVSHRLEVIELILREDEIPFSMKWAYGAGNSDMWLFEGTAKKNGDNYIAYTFYIANEGKEITNYWYQINILDVIKNVDDAVRIKVYENGIKSGKITEKD